MANQHPRDWLPQRIVMPRGTETSGLPFSLASFPHVDGVLEAFDDPTITTARGLYTRLMKTKDVTKRLDDAALNQSASGNGGNRNAVRQAIKPLVKNGPQKMRNATKPETAALRRVVHGGVGQNVLRALSAFDPTAGKLTALLQGGAALSSGGLTAASIPVGIAGSLGESALQSRNIKKLLDLISVGGSKQALKRIPTPASYRAEQAIAGLRAPLIAASVPALAAARDKPKTKPPTPRPAR